MLQMLQPSEITYYSVFNYIVWRHICKGACFHIWSTCWQPPLMWTVNMPVDLPGYTKNASGGCVLIYKYARSSIQPLVVWGVAFEKLPHVHICVGQRIIPIIITDKLKAIWNSQRTNVTVEMWQLSCASVLGKSLLFLEMLLYHLGHFGTASISVYLVSLCVCVCVCKYLYLYIHIFVCEIYMYIYTYICK